MSRVRLIQRAVAVSLAIICVSLPAYAQRAKKTKADIALAQQKMLDAVTKAKTTGCGTTIASHVYNPDRFQVYSKCIAVNRNDRGRDGAAEDSPE